VLKVLPIVVVFLVALYFGVRTAQRRLPGNGSGRGPGARPNRPGKGPRRPLGPDDDPDFLRGLGK